ncbi:MAG: hypothetical protein L3J82_10490, partial [Planctomycetes bacterium]|nr:hypothetical protein [Planctomycetota bacterium]
AVQPVNNEVPYDRENFGHVPDAMVYLMINMTARDPNARPTARQLQADITRMLSESMQQPDIRLSTLDDLLKRGTATQFLPTQPMPIVNQPTVTPAFQTPAAHPMQHPQHSFSQPLPKKNNTMLYIAIAVLAFFMLMFVGCAMFMASAGSYTAA